MKTNRREFVGQAALAVGSLSALDPAADGGEAVAGAEAEHSRGKPPLLPVVDTHQHLWDLDKLRLPWLKSAGHLNRSYLMKDYLAAAAGLNVVKTVYMEVDVEQRQQLAEAEYVVQLCRRSDNPMAAAVIGGRPAADGFRRYIGRFKDSPYVKGVRQILQRPEQCRDPALIGGVRLLGELGMSFDLCVPPPLLRAGAELIDRCPDTRFILDHCGNADPTIVRKAGDPRAGRLSDAQRKAADDWRRDIADLAKRKNVICKISGIVARAPKDRWTPDDLAPTIDHCCDQFGPDRVIFGGDWPVCTRGATLAGWVTALREILRSRPAGQQRKLLHDNAVRCYGV